MLSRLMVLLFPLFFASTGMAATAKVATEFADNLYKLHQDIMSKHEVRTTSENGGYGGIRGDLNFYKEVRYFDKKNGRLLSMIQWENENPDNIHTIEISIYDESGKVIRDYTAAYLPVRRKAPFQTLIGLYNHQDGLSSYRQYDAAGELLFEQCSGVWEGKKFRIIFEDYEIPDNPKTIEDATERAAYPSCFDKLPSHPGKYLNPMAEATNK